MKQVEQLITSAIKFLGEQDGAPEQNLKSQLVELFVGMDFMIRAYLVRIIYDDSGEFNVALCIRTDNEESQFLNDAINKIFSNMFKTNEHLDVLYLTEDREIALSKVCSPFFQKEAQPPLTL